jgi:predicted nucleic acid-binding protein
VLVLDASVILAAFDSDDAQHPASRAILVDRSVTVATLDLVRFEVMNVVVRAWREVNRASGLLAAIDRISDDGGVLVSTSALLSCAAEVAEQHEISVHDAAYVAAARHVGGTLVSCDTRDLVGRGLAVAPAAAGGGLAPTTDAAAPRSDDRSR